MKRYVFFLFLLLMCRQGLAQMLGVENSVGYLSSGTSIEPASTAESTPMIHGSFRGWSTMFHGNAVIEDIQQAGPRGGDKFFSTSWGMPMMTRQYGKHLITLRTMLSLEPATITKRRFPQLFQAGETAFGAPIVDGQHPHNFVMEVSGRYDFKLGSKSQLYFYGGPIADPALGPPAFPHRASASENVSAPLAHHEQDSTHISYNVITAGLSIRRVQLEASTFHGMEPNENRWYIGTGSPDSFSGRLTIAPTRNLVGQFSMGRINHREALEPELDTVRTTASVEQVKTFRNGSVATSLIWGRNKDLEHGERRIFNSYALESTVNVARNWVWTRIENVDRDRTLLSGTEETPIGRVQAFTGGYERDVVRRKGVNLGLGVQVTGYRTNQELRAVYGENLRTVSVFLRLRPLGNMAEHMKMMHGIR